MNSTHGQIHSFVDDSFGTRVVVEVDAAEACPRCAAGKGCGAALFASSGRRVEVSVPENLSLAAGDIVEISLAPDNLLRASLIVYGLPLMGAVVAVSVAYGLSLGCAAVFNGLRPPKKAAHPCAALSPLNNAVHGFFNGLSERRILPLQRPIASIIRWLT